jgi:hypothetical protein
MKNLKRNTYGLSFLIALLCLCGCDNTDGIYQVENYQCTSEQLDLVKKEFDICKGAYADHYCFRQAKKTQCDKLSEKQNTAKQ